MHIIYEPRGKAREYAELALNVRPHGCEHSCIYCYCPQVLHMKREDFFKPGLPAKNLFDRLESDLHNLSKLEHCPEVLISFISDPYQPIEMSRPVMPSVIQLFNHYQIPFTILTKGGTRIVRDFDLLTHNRFSFGTSISFYHDWIARKWEPYAASTPDRFEAIKMAKKAGIKTWISMEPVIDPDEAMQFLAFSYKFVDHFKVGKINYMPEVEAKVDWIAFRNQAVDFLETVGASYYIKESLRKL